ncbi:hypothetical protein ACLPFM_01145 [Providencia stuartii]
MEFDAAGGENSVCGADGADVQRFCAGQWGAGLGVGGDDRGWRLVTDGASE